MFSFWAAGGHAAVCRKGESKPAAAICPPPPSTQPPRLLAAAEPDAAPLGRLPGEGKVHAPALQMKTESVCTVWFTNVFKTVC